MRVLGTLLLLLALAVPGEAAAAKKKKPPVFKTATTSSPISMSRDGRYVWVVSPGADSVVVISTRTKKVVRTIKVGDQPESVALDPAGKHAYVANTAAGTVTVIRITRATKTRFSAAVDRKAGRRGTLTTGSEPWNIVASPDGRRIFVANSVQDTITVIDATLKRPRIIGSIDVGNSRCNDLDRERAFQPRGLAVTKNSKRLYATSFFSMTRPGGRQGYDLGRQGMVCRLNVKTKSRRIRDYKPAAQIPLGPQITGFKVDSTGDGIPDNTSAFPNQLQSIAIRGNQAYLPNIAASPDGPLRFNVDTQAFVSVIDQINGSERDAGPAKFINLHLGARDPEPGKKRLFFANPWAIAFSPIKGADTVYGGAAGSAYVVSAASDLLVKVFVRPDGKLVLTQDNNTTRYIDLADPANAATSGANAGHNPIGIVTNGAGTRAYVANFVSRNVSIVDLTKDAVVGSVRTAPLPAPGSPEEVVSVGAYMFFSSRGEFDRPPGATVSTSDRLSSEGWQACSSCHFNGLTDSIAWVFNAGPRKSVPLNATFNPHDRANDQRVLNYSAIFDEVEDFEANIRNVSGPGNLAAPIACSDPPPATSQFDPAHGLLTGDNGNVNTPPCVVNSFGKPNAGRPQLTITLPGSTTKVPALTALTEWVRNAVRTPNRPMPGTGGDKAGLIATGRGLFMQAGCNSCHGGSNWTSSRKDFTSPPAAPEIFTETNPAP
jgi:YVTN family beta-propeller protein